MKSRIATGGPRTILISVLLAADSSEHSEESSAADFARPVVRPLIQKQKLRLVNR